jgi:hypothetical protein
MIALPGRTEWCSMIEPDVVLAELDAQVEALRAEDRRLRNESLRISEEIKALRPELYAAVALKKRLAARHNGRTHDQTVAA